MAEKDRSRRARVGPGGPRGKLVLPDLVMVDESSIDLTAFGLQSPSRFSLGEGDKEWARGLERSSAAKLKALYQGTARPRRTRAVEDTCRAVGDTPFRRESLREAAQAFSARRPRARRQTTTRSR
jgi:hypothetical protein